MNKRPPWAKNLPERPHPPASPKLTRRQKERANRFANSNTTVDVIEWLRTSGPRDLEEIEVLRKGMRKDAMIRERFQKQISFSQNTGRELWYIDGHTTTLVLASDKARAFFRKKLLDRRKHYESARSMREAEERGRLREARLRAEFEAMNKEMDDVPREDTAAS